MYHKAPKKIWATFFWFYPLKKLLFLEGVLDLPDFQEFGSGTEFLEKCGSTFVIFIMVFSLVMMCRDDNTDTITCFQIRNFFW